MHALLAFLMTILAPLHGGVAAVDSFLPHHEKEKVAPLPTDSSGEPLRIPIFIYHTVAADTGKKTSPEDFVTSPELLDQQLSYIEEEGYTTVTMKEVADMIRRGTTSPIEKPVALTFDDGWESQYKNALPLLEKHHVKATFYIYPNPISKDDRFMTWEELANVRDAGFEIADHSYTHPLLSKLTPDELHHELSYSKTVLEDKLGVKVTNFASPFGYSSPAVIAELKADGYDTGRTTNPGMTHAASSTYALNAYLVHQSLYDFQWALKHAK